MLMGTDVDPLTGGVSVELRVLQVELTLGAVSLVLIR